MKKNQNARIMKMVKKCFNENEEKFLVYFLQTFDMQGDEGSFLPYYEFTASFYIHKMKDALEEYVNSLNLSDEVTAEELNLITRHFLYTSTNDETIHKGLDIQFADEDTAKKMEEESVACTKNIVNRYLAITKTVA